MFKKKSNFRGAKEMAKWLRALVEQPRFSFQHPHNDSQTSRTPIPGNLTSGLCTHMYILAGKTFHTHKMK